MQGASQRIGVPADSKRKDRMIAAAVREPGWQVAMSLMQALTGTDGKAGVLDPDEIQAREEPEGSLFRAFPYFVERATCGSGTHS